MKIAEEEIWDKHESLFHYTDQAGILGILKTNDLWASSYKFLNDAQEVTYFREVLLEVLIPYFEHAVEKAIEIGRIAPSLLEVFSGADGFAKRQTEDFIATLYRSTFERGDNGVEAVHPFFVSFCSHANEYEKNNGLLSQWRGYGGGGGYAIEFDTLGLTRQIEVCVKKYEHTVAYIGDVLYGSRYSELGPISSRIDKIIEIANRIFTNHPDPFQPESYEAFVNPATRIKHRGFHEECEVRVVIAPMLKGCIFDDESIAGDRFKTILCRNSKRGIVPYIQLLEETNSPLPIKKIIVGPSVEQERNFNAIMFAVEGLNIDVAKSSTPFIG